MLLLTTKMTDVTDSLPTKKADALPTTHVALSLTEDYCPSWGVWEGVRELIQNVHDGALESGGTSWSKTGEDSFASGEAATITYDRARQRLVLINGQMLVRVRCWRGHCHRPTVHASRGELR